MCTEECGRLEPPNEHALAVGFAEAAQRVYGSVAARQGCSIDPVEFYDVSGARRAITADELRFPFLAMMRLTSPELSIRVSYGHREYELTVDVARHTGDYHPLRVWLNALNRSAPSGDDAWLTGWAAVEHHVGRSAQLVECHLSDILDADEATLARLGEVKVHSASTIGRRLETAQAAFANGEYRTFVDLVGTLEDVLTTSDRQRLAFARAKL